MPVERCSTSTVVDVPASNTVNAFILAAFVRPVSYDFSWPIFSGAFNYVDEVVNRAAIDYSRSLFWRTLPLFAYYQLRGANLSKMAPTSQFGVGFNSFSVENPITAYGILRNVHNQLIDGYFTADSVDVYVLYRIAAFHADNTRVLLFALWQVTTK